MNGKHYSQTHVCELYYKTLQRFKKEHPTFIDCKFIFAPLRFIDTNQLKVHIETYKTLKAKFPDFIAGFDLVGQEDKGFPLKGFAEELIAERNNIPYFFHAGETNWNGIDSDENILDAILLGTKRIGHGFALVKHPRALEEVKKRQICIEVNPVSNQVLKLVEDMRNHPAAVLFSDNYPVVVSSDDPSFWEACPLTSDFYFAFMGIASARADLKFIKQLVLNSLKFSSMTPEEQTRAEKLWTDEWNKFLDKVIEEFN